MTQSLLIHVPPFSMLRSVSHYVHIVKWVLATMSSVAIETHVAVFRDDCQSDYLASRQFDWQGIVWPFRWASCIWEDFGLLTAPSPTVTKGACPEGYQSKWRRWTRFVSTKRTRWQFSSIDCSFSQFLMIQWVVWTDLSISDSHHWHVVQAHPNTTNHWHSRQALTFSESLFRPRGLKTFYISGRSNDIFWGDGSLIRF
jgi:hypothetical protein